MSSDLFCTQLVSQNFSSGSCYENVSNPVAAGPLRNTTANDELAPSDNTFKNMLKQVSENKASSKAARPSDTQGTARDEDAGSLSNTDNLIGVNNQMTSVSNAMNAEHDLALEQINILDLLKLKQLGIETLAVDENGRPLRAAVNGATPGLANAPGAEAVRLTPAAALDLDKLQALLKQFQSNPDTRPSAEIRSLVELFNGLSGEHSLKNAKTVEIANLLQVLTAKQQTSLVEGTLQNESTGMQTGAAAKEAAGGLLTVLTSDLSSLNAQSDTTLQDTAKSALNLGVNAEDKQHLARLTPSVAIKGANSGDQAVAQKLDIDATRASIAASDGLKSDIKGLKDAMGLQHKNSSEVSGNNTDPALFSNSSSNKNESNLHYLKPVNLKADSTATEALGSKIMNTDSGNKDDGFSFSSQFQNELKTSENQHLVREAEIVQKELRSQTLDQIVQKAVLHLKNGQNEVRINLKPDFLGRIRMQIITDSQQVTVRILTEFPMVKELIENNIHQLKSDLQNHGLEIDQLEVFVSHDADQHIADQQETAAKNGKNSSEGDDEEESIASENGSSSASKSIRNNENTTIDFFA